MKVPKFIAAAVVGTTFSCWAYADDAHHEKPVVKQTAALVPASGLTEGEVRKVDKAAGKVTIKHGPLKNLDMPAMTMVFQVKDKAMLDKVKAGDKINFVADKVNGAYTVMQLETAK